MRLFRKRRPVTWLVRITTPEGVAQEYATANFELYWRHGSRSNDGYFLLAGAGGARVWIKPLGWTEPDRTAALDGTAALPVTLRAAHRYY